MSDHQLTFADVNYFREAIMDQNAVMTPVTIRRCVSIKRQNEYPDEPPVLEYIDIPVRADVREAALQEIAHSGGLLIIGDNILWTQEPIRGPQENFSDNFDPNSIADIIIIHNQEYTIVGCPLTGRIADPIIGGYQAYIRRRKGGFLPADDPANDQNNA